MKIPITRPYFDKNEIKELTSTVRSGWVMQGPKVEKFENMFARYVGAKYAVATSSGTTALHLALEASGIGQDDEIITTAFSFIATANSILYCGAYPAFCDIEPKTYNLDPEKVESFIKNKCARNGRKLVNKQTGREIKAIMVVDQVGMPADIDSIKRIARKYSLRVIDDAACALGSKYKGKMVGSATDVTCFSFHPRKVITTAEGGMITTNDRKIAEHLRMLRSHGEGKNGTYPHKGYNYRMSDLAASLGVAQMKKLNKILSAKKSQAARYDKAFKSMKMLAVPFVPKYASANYQSYIIQVLDSSKISREKLVRELGKSGISAKKGITAIHKEPLYRRLLGSIHLPLTEAANKSTLMIPIYPSLKRKEQDYIIKNIRRICKKY
ncbi:MAG: DegT/DnrJ/EryC1/StrS family aminotransferase [Candidatus Omnitrophota bacterium]